MHDRYSAAIGQRIKSERQRHDRGEAKATQKDGTGENEAGNSEKTSKEELK
jgi:hypothetical protein